MIECSQQIIFYFFDRKSNVVGLPVGPFFGVKATLNARKILMQHFETLLRATCCTHLATL